MSAAYTSNGLGGLHQTSYTYGGAKSHLHGRGLLGFRWVQSVDVATGIRATNYFRQDYPYIGLPVRMDQHLPIGVLINRVETTLSTKTLYGTTANFPFAARSVENSYELNGGLINTVTTNSQYDLYGNPTRISTSSSDGHAKITSRTAITGGELFTTDTGL